MGDLTGIKVSNATEALKVQPPTFETLTGEELLNMEFPDLEFVVDGILPKGLCLLVGRPKKGKSLWSAKIAECIATGQPWGEINILQGDVLYLALEDNNRRLQDRLVKMSSGKSLERLKLATQSPKMGEGFEEALRTWHSQVEKPLAVFVDTYAKIKPNRGSKYDEYVAEYNVSGYLQQLADELDIALLLVHHSRKSDAIDPYDTVLGSTGITAAVDTMILLRGTPDGTVLQGKGRDLEEFEHIVKLEKSTLTWTLVGNVEEVRQSETTKKVLEALQDGQMKPKAISESTGLAKTSVRQQVGRMVNRGEIEKPSRGIYKLPD